MIITLALPTTDTGLLQWSQNVVNLITPVPGDWGLVAGDVTTYTGLHTAFSTALAACDPAVRNKPAVVTKNQARANLKAGASLLANKIYASVAVSTAMKVEIGMPPRQSPMPVPAPSTAPVVEVIATTGYAVRIRLRDAAGARRGKPMGVSGASVFSFVGTGGAEPPASIADWTFEGNVGKVDKIDVVFPDSVAAGSKVWLTAFWFNGRKQNGPVATPLGVNLPGGGVTVAA